MNTILYFSPNGVAYETRAYSKADIAELVNDYGLESLTSTDRQFDFWFTPWTRGCQHRPNRRATGLLLVSYNNVHGEDRAAAPRRSRRCYP